MVNDSGSGGDKTTEKGLDFITYPNEYTKLSSSKAQKKQFIDLKVVEYPKNKGKGGAVRLGMMVAKGEYALMVDADAGLQ